MERDHIDDRVRLTAAIEQGRVRVAALEAERERETDRIETLRLELAALDAVPVIVATAHQPIDDQVRLRSPETLQIFQSLFRGRRDVYPTRFVNREGKQGYGPECANKFVRGKCELPRVKCGECTNQAFLPADEAAYRGHLLGQQVMGGTR